MQDITICGFLNLGNWLLVKPAFGIRSKRKESRSREDACGDSGVRLIVENQAKVTVSERPPILLLIVYNG